MKIKNIAQSILVILAVFIVAHISSVAVALGDTINTLDQWKSDGTNITQRTASKSIKITGLADGCLYLSASIVVTNSSNLTCTGGGGGGGSGSGTFATSTIAGMANIYINYPLNATDVVLIGSITGTSTAYAFFDPNTQSTQIGKNSTASTTLYGNIKTPSIPQGNLYIGSNGLLASQGTSTPSVTGPITYSGTLGFLIGGASGAFDCTSASATTKGCVNASDFSKFNSATTTFTSPLIYTLGTNAVTCQVASATLAGCLGASDFSRFNSATTTFSTGLTYTLGTNAVTVNTSQNIATLSNLTTNGLVTTSGSNGTLGVTVNSTNGLILAMSAGIPTWVSTTTFSTGLTYLNGNVTSTLGTSVDLTSEVTGTLPIANGGTNSTNFSANSIITSNSAGTALIATGTQLTVGNLLATTTATNHFGTSCNGVGNLGGQGIETCGNDAIFLGVLNTVQNINNQGYVGLNLLNDLGDSTQLYYAGLFYNGSRFSQNSTLANAFGTANDENNLLAFQNTIGGISLQASTSASNASTSVSIYVGGNNLTNFVAKFTSLGLDIGTSTAYKFPLIISSSTVPQLALQGTNTNSIWVQRSIGNNFYLATSSPTTFATTSGIKSSPLWIDGTTGTTTFVGLNITGSATSTSDVGFNLTTGCFAISGVCITGGGSGGSGTVTSVDITVPAGFAVSGNPITTSGTLALLANLSSMGIVTVNSAGTGFVATTSQLTVGSLISTTTANSFFTGALGVGTTTFSTAGARLAIASTTQSQISLIGAVTDPIWKFRGIGGAFYISTSTSVSQATSSIPALDISSSGTTTVRGLNINAFATSTSNVGLNITTGCFSIAGVCTSGSSAGTVTSVDMTVPAGFAISGNPVTTSGTLALLANLSPMGIVTVNSAGTGLVATTSQLTVGSLISTTTSNSFFVGALGVGTTTFTTAGARLAIASTTQSQIALIGATTDDIWKMRGIGGHFYLSTSTPTGQATSSTSALDISAYVTGQCMSCIGTSTNATDALHVFTTVANMPAFIIGSSTGTYFKIDSIGAVGIGTTTPYATLSVQGISGQDLFAISTTTAGTKTTFLVDKNGQVFLGNYADCVGLTSAMKVDVRQLTCEAVTSDERLKKDFTHLPSPKEDLKKLLSIPAYTFYYIDNNIPGYDTHDTSLQTGFKAQDVQKVFPELVKVQRPTKYTPDGTLVLNYEGLIPHIQNSIVGLQEEIDQLDTKARDNWPYILIGVQFILFAGYVIYNEKKRK